MNTPLELNDAKWELWWQACRLQPTRLPLQNGSGKERV